MTGRSETMADFPVTAVLTEVPRSQHWIRLVWDGDVDAYTVRPLAGALEAAWALEPIVLEVDLSGVTFLDSAGVRPLVEARVRLLHRLRLVDPSEPVLRLLRLLGLEDLFVVVVRLPFADSVQRPWPDHGPLSAVISSEPVMESVVAEDVMAERARAGPPAD